jgi:hypothetical protein
VKALKVVIPSRLRPYLKLMAKRGLIGSTEKEVALYLIGSRLQDLIGSGYIAKHDEQMQLLSRVPSTKRVQK